MSASGVVSIAFAKIGFVLLCTIPSEMFPPGNNELIEMLEMLENYLAHLASQTRRAVVFKILDDIETVRIQPILALRISLHRMHVHRLVALVRVEMKPPALHIEDVGIGSQFHYKEFGIAATHYGRGTPFL
jgi:hypothetical protein